MGEVSCDKLIRLPIIDFSNKELKQGTPEWDTIKAQVHRALKEFGCFEASLDIVLEPRESVIVAFKQAFDLPVETKRLNVSEKPYHGYCGGHAERSPLYESIGIEAPNNIQNIQGLSNTFWPQGNDAFSNSIQLLSEQLLGVERTVRRMVWESLSLEKYMEEHMDSNYHLLRLMKYERHKAAEAKLGLFGHTDKSILTILYQVNDVDGLEVRTKNNEWINVKASPGSFIVMAGDILYVWLNGHVHTPFHRVMMRGNKTRYSAALFSVTKGGYIVKAPQELVDEQHPLLFKPYDHAEFLGFLGTEAGQKSECALTAHYGVSKLK